MTAENFVNQNAEAISKFFNFDLMVEEVNLIKEIERENGNQDTPDELIDIAFSGDRFALAKYHTKLLNAKIAKINETID